MSLPSISAKELSVELVGPDAPRILDVREAYELEISRLPNVVHIPLNELPTRFEELDSAERWVVVCRVGGRSAHATQFLLGQGFTSVRNFEGGMNAWAKEVDPSLSEY